MEQRGSAIDIFCCYARDDEDFLKKLKNQLSPLQRQKLVNNIWYDRDISAGTEWEQEIRRHLNEAHIILLLISAEFISSEYCYGTEMKRAVERHERNEAIVIPVIVRPVAWHNIPIGNITLGDLQALPTNGKPIVKWESVDDALFDVVAGIYVVITTLLTQKSWSVRWREAHQETQEQIDKASQRAQIAFKPIEIIEALDHHQTILIQFFSDNQKEHNLSINKSTITIGRTPDNDVCLDDPTVSRHHARIVRNGVQWHIEKLSDQNSLTVNKHDIRQPTPIRDGDEISIGPNVTFRWTIK